jgi:hypothetical protein
MKATIHTIFTRSVLLFLFYCYQNVIAQSTIHGTVTGSNNQPLSNANVLLLKAKDSSLVKGIITDQTGAYFFEHIAIGDYLITSTYTGLNQVFTPVISIMGNHDNVAVDNLHLSETGVQLAAVTVTARKPLLEQKIDRMVVNVANSITSAGNTALEVLERSPGVMVDHQNNVLSMNGKNGVVLMMNGKISYMPMTAAIQMLAGMSSTNIERIEIITTPPANLDAEGNAGYINIVLKSNDNFGTNGSYSLTAGYGTGTVSGASINLNHRKGRINLYGDFSYSRVKTSPEINVSSIISNKGIITQTTAYNHRSDTTRNANGRFGMDYELSKHTVIGILLSAYDNHYSQSESNTSSRIKNNVPDTSLKLNNTEVNHWQNVSSNINLQHSFEEGENVSVNFDYIHYRNNQPVQYLTSYYNGAGNFVYDVRTKSGKITPINILVGAVDYTKKLSNKVNMEAGIKGTKSEFNNDISFEKLEQNTWVKNNALSAVYKLLENYEAAYASFNITADKNTEAKVGLRYEYTNSNLSTTDVKNIVDRHYGNLFPSLFVSRKLDEKSSVNFAYSRRITRPTFNDLAPFTYYIDPNSLLTGNPALQPSVSNTIKGGYTFKKYFFSLSYTKEDQAITGFQPSTDSTTNKTIFTPQNLINQNTVSAILSVPINVTKWWSMQYNITGVWQQINALYKAAPVRLQQLYANINGSQNFRLPKDWSLELSGFYQSPSLNGIFLSKGFGSLDLGIKKKMKDQKGAFLFTTSNILNTLVFGSHVHLPEQNLYADVRLQFTQRTYKLTYTRSFGNAQLKGTRNRSTGAEEEKGRVQ